MQIVRIAIDCVCVSLAQPFWSAQHRWLSSPLVHGTVPGFDGVSFPTVLWVYLSLLCLAIAVSSLFSRWVWLLQKGWGRGALVYQVRGPCLMKAILQDLAEILQHVADIFGSMPKHAPQDLQEILAGY